MNEFKNTHELEVPTSLQDSDLINNGENKLEQTDTENSTKQFSNFDQVDKDILCQDLDISPQKNILSEFDKFLINQLGFSFIGNVAYKYVLDNKFKIVIGPQRQMYLAVFGMILIGYFMSAYLSVKYLRLDLGFIFMSFCSLSVYFHVKMGISDPGIAKLKSLELEGKFGDKFKHSYHPRSKDNYSSCSMCKFNDLTGQSTHCFVCDACVLERDHHCGVYGVCIGHDNIKTFYAVIIIGCISICMQIGLLCYIAFYF